MKQSSSKNFCKIEKYINIEKIKSFMRENNYTHKNFSSICKISTNTLSKILNGKSNFRLINLLKISKAMNAHLKDLFIK